MDQVLVVIAIKFGGQLDILWTSWWSIKLFGTRLVVSSAASDTRSTPRRAKFGDHVSVKCDIVFVLWRLR